jgi:hypothetical protein
MYFLCFVAVPLQISYNDYSFLARVWFLKLYEKHVLVGLSPIYYWIYKCTTCHHYTNIIKIEIYLQNVEGTS